MQTENATQKYKTYMLCGVFVQSLREFHLNWQHTLNHSRSIKKLYLTVCSYHVTYALQSESTLYICLNVKELLARNRRDIWSLSDWNGTRTHNHLVHKRTLNHLAKLAKWLSCVMSTYLYRAFDCIFLSYHVRTSDITSVSGKEFLDILSNIEFGFTLKCVRDMTRTYSQIKRTDKYSQHSSIIGPVWPIGWVFVYELYGCGFESLWNLVS